MRNSAKQLDHIRTDRSLTAPRFGLGCSTAVLQDFHIFAANGPDRSGKEIRAELEHHGYVVERMWATLDTMSVPTLDCFIQDHPAGQYVLLTGMGQANTAHSMALRDGRLTDTSLGGGGGRKLNIAYQVTLTDRNS